MERRLRNDLATEAAVWGGRIMLHAEVALPTASIPSSPAAASASPSSCSAATEQQSGAQQTTTASDAGVSRKKMWQNYYCC